ncbi:MAG: glycosyl hydrolase [Ruminococcaceae bacterium]|nr:glycosyl hydrolase [Oscillospiraceae bacterium]
MKYTDEQIKAIIKKMTIKQKAQLCCGRDGWSTEQFDALGIPSITVSDGPHGLRKKANDTQELGLQSGIASTCFPTSATTACSWDEQLLRDIGAAIGEECLQEDVQVLLGPGANIKRTPLCGRNFEYFSEDPMLSSHMAGALITGVQSKGVGACLKHFLANNQETNRYKANSVISQRALREIYLASFEYAVRNSRPDTIMCSYNRLNGVYCSENKTTLTDILRGEWGYEGFVMSDWGAVNERADALNAGLELEMPSSHGIGVKKLMKAIRMGEVSREAIDTACERLLKVIFRLHDARVSGYKYSADRHNELAIRALERSAVLLKNDGVLPLHYNDSVAVIGDMADVPRIQGAGSSQVTPLQLTGILEGIRSRNPREVVYAKGYVRDSGETDQALVDEAVAAAQSADKAILVIGLAECFESEGYDRTTMRIPQSHIDLLKAVRAVQPNTIAVLINGAPVEIDWIDDCAALLEIYLGGQGVGTAVAALLYGDVSPSGRLAETFPVCLENCPADITPDDVCYNEDILVGYRYYTTRKIPVRFPFGYGLSYTSFEYRDLTLSAQSIRDTDRLKVEVMVCNTGSMDGAEVVQLYVRKPDSNVKRPLRELRAFAKVDVPQGEKRTVTFELDKRAFSYYDTNVNDWRAESGMYIIEICSDCETVILDAAVKVEDTLPKAAGGRITVDRNTTFRELMQDDVGRQLVETMMAAASSSGMLPEDMLQGDAIEMVYQTPLRTAFAMWGLADSETGLNAIIGMLNSNTGRKTLTKLMKSSAVDKLLAKMTK